MTEEEANHNTNERNQDINSTEPTPVNPRISGNNTPQTPSNPRKKKKAITVKVIQEKSSHPTIANWISGISAAISFALGIITLWLYFEAKKATRLTHDALAHQITKDSGDNVNRMHKDTLDSIADVKKLKRDTDFINKQKKGIDVQIASLKEAQKEFVISHEPILEFQPNTGKLIFTRDGYIKFKYRIVPNSSIPIEEKGYSILIHMSQGDPSKFLKEAFINPKYIQMQKREGYFRIEDKTQSPGDYPYNDDSVKYNLIAGKSTMFILGRIKYINYLNGKTRIYDFLVNVSIKNKLPVFYFEKDRNYDEKNKR